MANQAGSGYQPCIGVTLSVLVILGIVYAAGTKSNAMTVSKPEAPIYLKHEDTGFYLAFSPSNGLFYASNHSKPARFRLVEVSAPMVTSLYEQARQHDTAAIKVGLGGVKVTTRSGCSSSCANCPVPR